MTGRAVLYLRVSTDDQSTGLDVQRAACRRWVEAQGLQIGPEYLDEGVSGGLDPSERPGLWEALSALGKGDVLVVHKRDRLARDVVAAGMAERLAEKAGAVVRCADGTGNGSGPEAALMRGIVDLFAQYERALIRWRTAAALQAMKARGEAIGGKSPYGWRKVGPLLVEDAAEQAARDRMFALRAQGLSYQKICDRLVEEGYAPRASKWFPSQIMRSLAYEPATPARPSKT